MSIDEVLDLAAEVVILLLYINKKELYVYQVEVNSVIDFNNRPRLRQGVIIITTRGDVTTVFMML